MKKIDKTKMHLVIGGKALPCGWIGILAVVTYTNPLGILIGPHTGLNSEIGRCWDS
jgi:hypothetical protein